MRPSRQHGAAPSALSSSSPCACRHIVARAGGRPKACLQQGDPEAAIAWLESIPARFRPASLAEDPVFAPLRQRADFKALFER